MTHRYIVNIQSTLTSPGFESQAALPRVETFSFTTLRHEDGVFPSVTVGQRN